MCGICGKFSFTKDYSFSSRPDIESMCQVMTHRGPDAQGIMMDGAVGLGIRRLKVIDLESGDQPVTNEDGTISVVLNGEIYNYRELRAQLMALGHSFKTKSDTEVLVHLYEEYGDGFIERCNGMFAFCIYDSRRQRLYLGRDRVGKKPLFYYIDDKYFVFGSELKCLFVNNIVPRRVDESAIFDYLIFGFVPSPKTAFRGIYQLEPAHYMVVERGRLEKKRYWTPQSRPGSPPQLADALAEYLDLLSTCVKDRLVSDVPVGLLLSGGIDSCSIAAIMAKEEVLVPTFTIRFKSRSKDEGQIARAMASHVGAIHEEMFVEIDDAVSLLPQLVWHYEQPYSDSSAIPTYCVAKMARQRVTVVLNGDGGDEVFGGYWRHLFGVWLEHLNWVPDPAWHLLELMCGQASHAAGEGRTLRWLKWTSQAAQKDNFGASWYWLARLANQVKPLLNPSFAREHKEVPPQLRNYWDSIQTDSFLNRILLSTDLQFRLVDDLLVKMDRATMANSLEARSPFLDYRMIEFGASLPASWKVRGFTTKWFSKLAMSNYLPPEVLKKRKTGFGVPIREWMEGDLGQLAWKMVLSDRALARGYFQKDALSNLRTAFQERKVDCSHLLYRLMFLELWHRSFIDDFFSNPPLAILDIDRPRLNGV